MKRLPVSVFRITVASLTEPTEVTSDGKIIGTWTPGFGAALYEPQATFTATSRGDSAATTLGTPTSSPWDASTTNTITRPLTEGRGFGVSRPAPKPKK